MRTPFALLFAFVTAAPALPGQWSLAPEVGLVAFSGSGRDSAGVRVGPTRATALALRLSRESPRFGFGLRVLTGSTGFGASDGDLTVIREHQLRLVEVAGLLTWHAGRVGASSRLAFEAGPALDIWSPQDASTRTRIGGVAALVWAFPITPQLEAAVRLEGALTASLLDPDDVPAGAVRRATWRRGVAFALRQRLG